METHTARAKNAMEQLHHAKERIFPFSSHVTGLDTRCNGLARANDAVTERNKVAKMLKGIAAINPSLVAAMESMWSNAMTKSNFAAASSELSEQIALIFPGNRAALQRTVADAFQGLAQATITMEVEDKSMVKAKEAKAKVEDVRKGAWPRRTRSRRTHHGRRHQHFRRH